MSCLGSNGFAVVRGVCDRERCRELALALGPLAKAGRRGVLQVGAVEEVASSQRLFDLVWPHVGGEPFAVRAIYFNKSADANWFVGWHQDLTIAVRERIDTPGFDGWSVKDGVPHVQPPPSILERMLTVRLHLDEADASNGALRTIPGSHRGGRLSVDGVERFVAERNEVVCQAKAGDALLMRPLLLHSSGRSTLERARRVLHIEYAAEPLPGGLRWYTMCNQEDGS